MEILVMRSLGQPFPYGPKRDGDSNGWER